MAADTRGRIKLRAALEGLHLRRLVCLRGRRLHPGLIHVRTERAAGVLHMEEAAEEHDDQQHEGPRTTATGGNRRLGLGALGRGLLLVLAHGFTGAAALTTAGVGAVVVQLLPQIETMLATIRPGTIVEVLLPRT